jgi:hypothetical protein
MTKPSHKSENTFTLLVWEVLPEDTHFYLIPNSVADEYRHCLEQAHNRFLNCNEENEGMLFLNVALIEDPADAVDMAFKQYAAIFAPYKQEVHHDKPIIDTYITHVYLSGFAL